MKGYVMPFSDFPSFLYSPLFQLGAAILYFIGCVLLVRHIRRGNGQGANTVTWIAAAALGMAHLFSTEPAQSIAFAAAFLFWLGPVLVLWAPSFEMNATNKFSPLEVNCLVMALFASLAAFPLLALLIASIPQLRDAKQEPEAMHVTSWLAIAIAAFVFLVGSLAAETGDYLIPAAAVVYTLAVLAVSVYGQVALIFNPLRSG